MTVQSVAQVLHVAPTTVRNLVQRGVLHPLDGPPPLKFSRDEVLRVAALSGVEVKTIPTDGEVAAAAFASFRGGKSVRDVVIEHKIPPDHAELLLQRYCAMGGDMVFPGEVVRKIQALGFFQNRALDPHELPMLLQDLLSYYEQADPNAQLAQEACSKPPHEPPSS